MRSARYGVAEVRRSAEVRLSAAERRPAGKSRRLWGPFGKARPSREDPGGRGGRARYIGPGDAERRGRVPQASNVRRLLWP